MSVGFERERERATQPRGLCVCVRENTHCTFIPHGSHINMFWALAETVEVKLCM